MSRMTDEEVDRLERVLSSDNEVSAEKLAAEARRARASERVLVDVLKDAHDLLDNLLGDPDDWADKRREFLAMARAALKQVGD